MANLMPFLLSMLLGRTIDLSTYSIGSNIYDDINYVETPIYQLNATYHVLEGKHFPYEDYGMPMDIVLRIKATDLSSSSGSMGLDGLLKGTSWMHNSAVVAVGVVYTSMERSLAKNATLLSDWKTRISAKQTHYASSIVHGGWFVVLYRFKCVVPSDVTIVRKILLEILGTSNTLGQDAPQLWFKVKLAVEANQDVRGEVVVETHVYTSIQLPKMIENIQTLATVINDFPKLVGKGSPMYMGLKPLSKLDSSFPTLEKHEGFVNDFLRLDLMYDDVKQSRTSMMNWLKNSPSFEDDQEDKIYELLDTLTRCLKEFLYVINNLSLYVEPDRAALKRVFDIYEKGLSQGIPSYLAAYLKLKEEIDTQCESDFLRGIRGLLNVYPTDGCKIGEVGSGGIEECKKKCVEDHRCRSIGYSDEVIQIDNTTGNYVRKKNQCWVYYRSTSTAEVETPNGLSGDLRVYDRRCS